MTDQLIDSYLHELKTSAWIRQVPASRTAALVAETRDRISAALAAAGKSDEATVYRVLDGMAPASDIVERDGATSHARWRSPLAARGWGLGEIGGLLLLIVGPFVMWWIGPIFGVILIGAAANRWSDQSEHRATVFVFVLLGVQFAIAAAVLI
jgi:hypothetical protein